MSRLEEKSRKRGKRKRLQKIILSTIAGAGILGIGLLAPNVIGAMAKLGFLPNKRQNEYISSSASKLVRRGLLFYDGKKYRMTPKGEYLLR